MSNKGWIKLHRQIQDCWLWRDEPFTKGQAWIDLLLSANHNEKKISIDGKPVVIERGQFHTSTLSLAARWKWDRRKVMRFLDVLEEDNMLTQYRSSKGTTLTIVNYGIYQDDGTTLSTTDGTTHGTSDGTAVGTTDGTTHGTQTRMKRSKKNEKNEEEGKNERNIYFPNDEILNEAFKDFVAMRKKIKAPLTDRATDMAIKKLEELGNGDNDLMLKICNQTVLNSWKGFYPLKEEQKAAGDWVSKWENA